MKLRGDRCQCSGCGKYFNSTAAFDKHRRGEMTARKCLTEQEMTGKGMERNSAGFWITGRMPTRPAFTFGKPESAYIND